MKILITGVSGTGKSTIAKALRERGVYTVDFSDVRNLCFWRDIQTKEKTRYSSVATHEWFDSHEYICDLPRLQEILNEREDIAMTGVASGNQTQILGICPGQCH
jgi:adenylate kinase family enzyme